MRNEELVRDYIRRAGARLQAVGVLFEAESWLDVVRESQGDRRACAQGPP